jgi:hypothetical protein
MVVPYKFTVQLHNFYVRIVQLPDDPRMPLVMKEAEFFFQIYFFHSSSFS